MHSFARGHDISQAREGERGYRQAGLLASKLQRGSSHKAVRCWLVTRDEPTADQRKAAERHKSFLTELSFSQFQSRLIDVRMYLTARENYAFGSVRDPVTGSPMLKAEYVPLALAELGQPTVRTPDELAKLLAEGRRVVLLGDYGAGKSMTLRYIHRSLATRYYKGQSPQFPVHLNLRDHYGQTDPAEILERHARTIGFEHPAHLVRAWRGGYVLLLLDGFDEVTGLSIQGLWRKLRDNRYRAMEPIRRLMSEHPAGLGLAIAGRAHFFDTDAERRAALGTTNTMELSLNEFTDEQVQQYLKDTATRRRCPLLASFAASLGRLLGFDGTPRRGGRSMGSRTRTCCRMEPPSGQDYWSGGPNRGGHRWPHGSPDSRAPGHESTIGSRWPGLIKSG